MLDVAVFFSGSGSNLLNIIKKSINNNLFNVKIAITNNISAGGIDHCKDYNIPVFTVDYSQGKTKAEEKILDIIGSSNIDLICLAGFMKIVSKNFLDSLDQRTDIINIHPSLLPAFKGANAVQDALDSGCKFTGCTIHYVNAEVDSGKIIDQIVVPIYINDSFEKLLERIHHAEHELYPRVIERICINKKRL